MTKYELEYKRETGNSVYKNIEPDFIEMEFDGCDYIVIDQSDFSDIDFNIYSSEYVSFLESKLHDYAQNNSC